MRNLKKLFVTILLTLALGAPVYAGDIQNPPSPDPPPVVHSSQPAPAPDDSDSQASTAPDDFIDTTTVMFDLLYSVLSIY